MVDNASADGTAELVTTHPSGPTVRRHPVNLGYAGGLAATLPEVTTEFVAWLNDDAAPDATWLAALEDALDADPGLAAVSARLEPPGGGSGSAGVGLTRLGYGTDLPAVSGEVFGFCGGAALLRRSALTAVGGVPADFFCYYEDTDTSWRLRLAGWRVATVPSARAEHLHGASTRPGSRRFHQWNERNRLLMLIRCAPGRVVLVELARFVAITARLAVRGLAGRRPPTEWNFRVRLRLQVLTEVLARLPRTTLARQDIASRSVAGRMEVWRAWAGR